MARTLGNWLTDTNKEIPKNFATATDPGAADINTAMVDAYNGVVITTTAAPGAALTIGAPTDLTAGAVFTVINNDTSTHTIVVDGEKIAIGDSKVFQFDGSAWVKGGNATPSFTAVTDPAVAALNTAMVDAFEGVVITTTAAAPGAYTLGNPTDTDAGAVQFAVTNNNTSTDFIEVNNERITPGQSVVFVYDGDSWSPLGAASGDTVQALTDGAIVTFNIDNGNIGTLSTALPAVLISNPTGTPVVGNEYTVIVTNTTGSLSTISWGTSYLQSDGQTQSENAGIPAGATQVFDFSYNGSAFVETSAASSFASNKIDASAGTVTETLTASTNSGVVRLYTNIDVSNTATLAVQTGETLNGETNGTFLFSSYAVGTQFRVDEVNGGWVVTPTGESTSSSSRIGEFFFAKSGSTVEGYLAVNPGTITNGALLYPIWAGMYPEFVTGNDIVFPTDVEGMFLRNTGGNATTEGTFQADATAPNGMSTSSAGAHTHTYTYRGGGIITAKNDFVPNQVATSNISGTTSSSGNHTHSITGGSVETRPDNRSYQLYTIVDTYNEKTMVGLATPSTNGMRVELTSAGINTIWSITNPSDFTFETEADGGGCTMPHSETVYAHNWTVKTPTSTEWVENATTLGFSNQINNVYYTPNESGLYRITFAQPDFTDNDIDNSSQGKLIPALALDGTIVQYFDRQNTGEASVIEFVQQVSSGQKVQVGWVSANQDGGDAFDLAAALQDGDIHTVSTAKVLFGYVEIELAEKKDLKLPESEQVSYTEWTSYGPITFGGTVTAPTKGTVAHESAYYKVVGKSLHIKYTYEQTNNTGSAAGSGAYLFPIPAGFTIDTSQVRVNDGVNFSSTALGVAEAHLSGVERNPGVVHAHDPNNLVMVIADGENTMVNVGNTWFALNGGSAMSYSFTAEIPLL